MLPPIASTYSELKSCNHGESSHVYEQSSSTSRLTQNRGLLSYVSSHTFRPTTCSNLTCHSAGQPTKTKVLSNSPSQAAHMLGKLSFSNGVLQAFNILVYS